jgi:VWFA-related protein
MIAALAFAARIVVILLVAGMSLVPQVRPEPATPAFGSQVNLVMVPFQVSRSGHFVTDLKTDDFVLLQDGVPREFTVFEGPQNSRPVELVLLFDTTTWSMGGDWKLKLEQIADFTNHWNESMSHAVLAGGGADIRASVYHFDGVRLERLCRSTTDPKELLNAIHQLLAPIYDDDLTQSQRAQIAVAIAAVGGYRGDRGRVDQVFQTGGQTGVPAGVTIPLDLPVGREILPADAWQGGSFRGWPLEAAIGTLKDSAATADSALRALIMFSDGRGGTTTVPEDVAGQAVALGIPVYPVPINISPYARGSGGRGEAERPVPLVADLGSMTGGHWFDVEDISAGMVRDILENVRNAGLALAHSQYNMGFVPAPSSGPPRSHKLEVKFASKSKDKVTGGMRVATY